MITNRAFKSFSQFEGWIHVQIALDVIARVPLCCVCMCDMKNEIEEIHILKHTQHKFEEKKLNLMILKLVSLLPYNCKVH